MKKLIFAIGVLGFSSLVRADWGFSLGYNNPPGASVGANFTYFWSQWAFEFGIGSVNTSSTDDEGNRTNRIGFGGDLNLKYLFRQGVFRPYLQAGLGAGVGAGNSGVSAGANGAFGGAGLFLKGSDVFGYLSYNVGSGRFVQAGLGFMF